MLSPRMPYKCADRAPAKHCHPSTPTEVAVEEGELNPRTQVTRVSGSANDADEVDLVDASTAPLEKGGRGPAS